MNESSGKSAVMVGLFVFIGLAFLVAGVLMIGNLHETFTKKMQVVSLFEDVSGLQTGNNVWFSGVKIGTVSGLNFYGKSQVAVKLKIDTKVQQYIRKDSKVKISTDGLIGNKILVIYGGSEQARQVQQGDTLLVEKTFSSEDMINMLQENNKNLLAITTDFKSIGKKLAGGEGTLGKLLSDDAIYTNIHATTESLQSTSLALQSASVKTGKLMDDLTGFSSKLNTKGTLANELVTDTAVFHAVKASAVQLQKIADTALSLVTKLQQAGSNPNTPVGTLLYDEKTGAHLKETIKNLELGSKTLNDDLEAVQHNFLLRKFFKKKEKAAKISN